MNMKLKTCIATILFGSSLCLTSIAEVVRVPLGEQADLGSVVKPARGLSSRAVEAEFGQPVSRHGPVGDPPIYYWEYETFTVYFEDSYVIHAVSKLKSKVPVKK